MNRTIRTMAMMGVALWAWSTIARAGQAKDPQADQLDRYNVVWDSPSKDALGSMPLGNGDVGINAWVEENGDMVFYISKTDAWDENARLCKIGRVRVKFDPPLAAKDGFRQELRLGEGVIEIRSQSKGFRVQGSGKNIPPKGGSRGQGSGSNTVNTNCVSTLGSEANALNPEPFLLRLWIDPNQPVVRIEAESPVPVSCRAEVELWRMHERPLMPQEDYGYGDGKSPQAQSYKLTVLPDAVVTSAAPRVVWYHRNTRSLYPVCLEVQNLAALKDKFADPLLHLTFGASLSGVDMIRDGAKALKSAKPSQRHQLAVCVLTERAKTPDTWLKDLDRVELAALKTSFDKARQATAAWWQAFWNRSWVFVEVSPGTTNSGAVANTGGTTPAPPELTQGYVLQRFMNACSGRGGSPIKFNGSIFCVEKTPGASPVTEEGDPDWRNWGGSYWFQNTRLSYWPMLAEGDFEMTKPWFRMYLDALPLGKARIAAYYKFDGAASFQETMNFWGMPNNRDWGWGNNGPEPGNVCIHRYWSGGIELTAFMLDLYDFTQDNEFVRTTLVPLADPIIAFFDQYWPKRDANGKIILDPAQAIEALPWTVNPMPEIAGLHFILPRLLALPKTITTEAQRTRWARILKDLPPVPVAEVNGVKLLRPSGSFTGGNYSENPELYAVFPYRIFGVGKPDLTMARATYEARTNRHNFGWCQDSIQAACLGLGEEAGRQVVARAKNINGSHRFPAMWRGFDSIPDQDHGVNILTTLQFMLLQSDGRKICVLPAWPKNWNVSFKLHAPFNTTVEGVFNAGKLQHLKVTPESRRKDVLSMPDK